MRHCVAFLLMLGCGAGADDGPVEVEPVCNPVPQGIVAWRSGDLVMVSKKLDATASGVQLRAEIHNVPGERLPAQVDFGAELIEVRPDMSLCLLDR